MAWIQLALAGLLEIIWAVAMKKSHGFTILAPSVVMLVSVLASFAMLALAMRSLPLSTAYGVWSGIGVVGTFILGVTFLGEEISPLRLLAAGLIIAGIVLMKLTTP